MRKLLALAFAATLSAGGACGRGATSSQSATPALVTVVNVRNNRFYDMDVFVLRSGGGRTRLGMVTGNSSSRFTIPAYVVGAGATLRFYADPIGPSGVRVSEELNVQPGDNVQLDITP